MMATLSVRDTINERLEHSACLFVYSTPRLAMSWMGREKLVIIIVVCAPISESLCVLRDEEVM